MDRVETLLTIAELSIALAGFAGLVSVLGRHRDGESGVADRLRIQMMLEIALLNAAFALFPLPFLDGETSGAEIWRLGSGAHLASTLGLVFAGFYRYQRVRPRPDPLWITTLMSGFTVVNIALDAVNALGFAGRHSFSVFLATLLFSLVGAGLKFMAVADSVFAERGD